MKWYFEQPGAMHSIEVEAPALTDTAPDYDYFFSDTLWGAAERGMGSNLWLRDQEQNHLVWQCEFARTYGPPKKSRQGGPHSGRLADTLEHHEFALRMLSMVRPLWECVAGKNPILERAMETRNGWIAGSVLTKQLKEAVKDARRAAAKYRQELLNAYAEAVVWFCSPDRDELFHEGIDDWLELVEIDVSSLRERIWADILMQRLLRLEELTQGQRIGLLWLRNQFDTLPEQVPQHTLTGLWMLGSSQPEEEMSRSILSVARGNQPTLFFIAGGSTEKICDLEKLIHGFRLRQLQLVMKSWTTPFVGRDDVLAALVAYEQWIDGSLAEDDFMAAVVKVKSHVPDDDESDMSDTECDEEDSADTTANFLLRAVSELGSELISFPFLYHMVLRDMHAAMSSEKADDMTETGHIRRYPTTLDRDLAGWIAAQIRLAVDGGGKKTVVQQAALQQLQIELDWLQQPSIPQT